jgi:hypothetical protein
MGVQAAQATKSTQAVQGTHQWGWGGFSPVWGGGSMSNAYANANAGSNSWGGPWGGSNSWANAAAGASSGSWGRRKAL